MKYYSTRDKNVRVSAAEAIARGLSREGGLFVPETFPQLTEDDIAKLRGMSYPERAAAVMGLYLDDYTPEELRSYCRKAYGARFSHPAIAPVVTLPDGENYLELWHGPTCAFKDMALQILPYLLTAALKKTGETKHVCILVATSGDTGKAALEGFRDVPGTRMMVFYPRDGVSDIQKLQMVSQEGENVSVCAVTGNFDDAQTGVKRLFSDEALRRELAEKGWFLSSANSINWGRLLPQIVYYVSACCDLLNSGTIAPGEKVHFCVPTGNFGDILAGYYARRMGLPIGRLICASNSNNVLTDFIRTGVYDKNRRFYTTISPSMDILVSSNLERLLLHLTESDTETAEYMRQLNESGRYQVSAAVLKKLQELFDCGFAGEEETKQEIAGVFADRDYLMDTHTAVASRVLKQYRERTGDRTAAVVVSTASAYKFCASVIEALHAVPCGTGVELIGQLEELTHTTAPQPLQALRDKQVRFTANVDKAEMAGPVRAFLSE